VQASSTAHTVQAYSIAYTAAGIQYSSYSAGIQYSSYSRSQGIEGRHRGTGSEHRHEGQALSAGSEHTASLCHCADVSVLNRSSVPETCRSAPSQPTSATGPCATVSLCHCHYVTVSLCLCTECLQVKCPGARGAVHLRSQPLRWEARLHEQKRTRNRSSVHLTPARRAE